MPKRKDLHPGRLALLLGLVHPVAGVVLLDLVWPSVSILSKCNSQSPSWPASSSWSPPCCWGPLGGSRSWSRRRTAIDWAAISSILPKMLRMLQLLHPASPHFQTKSRMSAKECLIEKGFKYSLLSIKTNSNMYFNQIYMHDDWLKNIILNWSKS